ncbi:MAG: hypothetical protein ACKV2Q_12425 [Planctomycetaceae bacterium]
MNPDPITMIFGGCVMLTGLLLQFPHRTAWLLHQTEFSNDPGELTFYATQYRRRRQTSGLIALVGLMIAVADLPNVWMRAGPLLASILWIAIGCVCLWIVLLALGDMLTTRAHVRASVARLKVHKDQLLNQLERLRPDAKANENKSPDSPIM